MFTLPQIRPHPAERGVAWMLDLLGIPPHSRVGEQIVFPGLPGQPPILLVLLRDTHPLASRLFSIRTPTRMVRQRTDP